MLSELGKIISSEAQVREKATHEIELGEYFFCWIAETTDLESKLFNNYVWFYLVDRI